MDGRKNRNLRDRGSLAVEIAILYLVAASLWYGGTSFILSYFPGEEASSTWRTIRDWLFISSTAALLWVGVGWLHQGFKKETADLADSEEIFRLCFENTALGLAQAASDGQLTRVNARFCEVMGHSRESLLSSRLAGITHPADRDEFIRQLQKAGQSPGKEVVLHQRCVRADGEVFWAQLAMSRFQRSGGASQTVTIAVEDISRRKETEAAIQESEAKFRALVEQSITGVYLVVDGVYAYVNRRLAELFGYTTEELIGKRMLDLVAECDRELVNEQVRQRLFGEIPSAHYTVHGLRKNGEVILIEVYGRVLVYHGRPALMGTLLDITERDRAAKELRESEERFRSLVNNVADCAIYMLDSEGRITSWNEGAERMTGYSSEDVLGRPVVCLYPRSDTLALKHDESLRQADQQWRAEQEGWHLRKNGTRFWAHLVITALRTPQGDLIGFTNITRDNTKAHLATEELHESREQLRALTARLLTVREHERTRLAHEIHYGLGRNLYSLKSDIARLRERIAAGPGEENSIMDVLEKLSAADVSAGHIAATSTRIAGELRPAVLDEEGLSSALLQEAKKFQETTGIECHIELPHHEVQLPENVTTALLRIFQEALGEAAAAGGVRRIHAHLQLESGSARLTLREESSRDPRSATASGGPALHLVSIRERAALHQGSLDVQQSPSGVLEVRVSLPLP